MVDYPKQDRESPGWWQDRINNFFQVMKNQREEYKRYAKWYSAESRHDGRGRAGLRSGGYDVEANMLHLAVRSNVADLMFRNPRFVSKPVQSFGPSVFTPKLSQVETKLLNDFVEEARVFRSGRKVLTDMSIGWLGVWKIGYSADIGVNDALIDSEFKHAEDENMQMLMGRKPKVSPSDLHKSHQEKHKQLLATIERGDLPDIPKKFVDYLRKHIKKHDEALEKTGEQPTEMIRQERVFAKRVNPLCFLFDPMAEDPEDREWVGQMYLRPVEYVKQDRNYNAEAREGAAVTNFPSMNNPEREDKYSGLEPFHDAVLIYEIVDLRDGKVRTFAHDAKEFLRNDPFSLRKILPSGPYIDEAFSYNPLTDRGVSPPKVYEGHQEYLALIESTMAEAASRAVPMTFVRADALTEHVQKALEGGEPAKVVPIQLGPADDIRRVIMDVPPAQLNDTLLLGADRQMRFIERLSGKGSARLAGGDFAKTATASAVASESTSTLAEDNASVVDDMMARVGKYALRLMRRFYSPQLVAELVGEEALEIWPTPPEDSERPNGFTDRDIVQDKGVTVVPGSMQRQNALVQQKLLTEFYATVLNNPIMLQTLPPEAHLELLNRILDTMGMTGISLEGSIERMQQAVAQQQQEAQGESNAARRGAEGGTDDAAQIMQGLQNMFGGRMPTGASEGDGERMTR